MRSLAIAAVLFLPILSAAAAEPGASPPPTPRNILHIRLSGDLDCVHLADDFGRLIQRCRSEKPTSTAPPLLILELDGRRWRSDVVLSIAKVIRAPTAPDTGLACIVYLTSPTSHVGTGQAALGLIADACYLAPKTRIAFEPADEIRDTIPAALDLELTDRELRGLAWTSLQDRQGDALLTTLIPRPSAALYAISLPDTGAPARAPSLKLSPAPPDGSPTLTITPSPGPDGVFRLTLDAELAERIGLSQGAARSVGEILVKRGLRAGRTTHESLSSGLAAARAQLDTLTRGIDESRRKADGAIDSVYRLHSTDAVPRQHRVGTDHLPELERAVAELERAEHLTADYPELLAAPPPGHTAVAHTASTIQKAWRDFFQSRRADLDRLAARAKTLSEK